LARAEIAWKLGKRFDQDQALDWGCQAEKSTPDLEGWAEAGSTRKR